MTGDAVDLIQLRESVDSSNMLGLVLGFPEQMVEAWKIGAGFAEAVPGGDFSRVVVCGMGGSAIGGDLLRSVLGDRLRVPVIGTRDYRVPGYLADGALVVVSSYSGNTAETLSAYDSLGRRPAGVVAVTSGGALAERCAADGVPVCRIPGGMPPRAAIAYSFFPSLQVLRAAGVAEFPDVEFDEAIDAADRARIEWGPDSRENTALDLAKSLRGKLPFVYAGPGLLEAAARRWACQFNENSKTLAHFAVYSELNHNEIVGWETLGDLRPKIALVSLEDGDDHEMTRQQTDIGLGIVKPLAGLVKRVQSGPGRRLSRLLRTVLLGDFASVYLAYLNGIDPTPVDKIDHLKRRLAELSG